MGDIGGNSGQKTSNKTIAVDRKVTGTDQATVISYAADRSGRLNSPQAGRDIYITDSGIVGEALHTVQDVVDKTGRILVETQTLTSDLLKSNNASLAALATKTRDALAPDTQRNILIAVGIGGAVLLFTGLARRA